jgi:hypothetical protein
MMLAGGRRRVYGQLRNARRLLSGREKEIRRIG